MPSGEFRVAAKDNLIEERMHTGKLSVTMTTDDPCYSVLEPVQLSVRIKDDELSAPVVRPIEVSEEKEVDFETDLGLTIKFPAAWLPVAKKGSVTDLNVNVTEMKPESVPKPIDVKVFSPQTIVSIRIEAIDSTDRFAAPVPLSIPISPSTNPELAAIVWSYGRSASDGWNVLENTIFDPATGTIKGLAEHFSIYVSTEVLPSVVITSTTSSLGDEPLVYTEDQPEALYPFDGANAVFEDGVTVLSEYICGLDVSLVNSNDGANALDGSEDQLAFGPSSESSADAQGFSAFYNASNLVLYLRKGDADGSALADDPAKGSQCAGKASLVEYAKALQMIRYRNPSQNPKNTGDNRALRVRVHEMHAKKTHTYPARIKVNSLNDPPTVQPSSNEMVYNEGTASRSLDGGLTIFDPEDHSLIRARVTIEPFDDTSDVFLFDSSNSAFEDGASLPTISKDSSNPSVGAYDISGAFPLLTYVNVLRSFKFKNDGPAIRFLKRTVTFRVEDVDGGVSNATRTLTIRERNDPPKAEDLALNVREDESVEGFGTNGMQATDPEGNKLTFRVVCPGSKGDLVLVNAQSGSFKYTPYPNEFGVDTIVYVARDDKGLDSNFATITVNIEATPDAPVANDAIYNNVFDGIDFVENLPVSDSDGDHDIKFIHIVVPPIYDKEAVQLTPAPGDSQNTDQTRQRGINPFRYFIKEDSETAKQEYDEFKYQVEDQGGALSNLATVKIYIKRQSQIVNQKPVLFPSDEYVREHGKIVFLINATDDRTKNLAFFYAGGSRPELGTLHSCDRTDAALPLKELCDGIVGPGDGSAGDPVEDTEFIGYGGKVVYSAKRHRHGVDAFSVVARDVQDKRSTPGELRIEVREQNDVPVPACTWFPWIDESQRTRQGMHYRLAPVAVISFFLYPVGILVHFAWVLFSNRDVLKNRYMIESWLSDAKDELDKDFKKEKQEKEQKEEKEEKERRKSSTEIDVSMAKARGIFAWMTLWFTSFVTFTKHQEARSPFEVLRENDAKSEDLLSHTKVEAFKGESGEANVKNALRLRTLQVAYGFLFKRYESGTLFIFVRCFLCYPQSLTPLLTCPLTLTSSNSIRLLLVGDHGIPAQACHPRQKT